MSTLKVSHVFLVSMFLLIQVLSSIPKITEVMLNHKFHASYDGKLDADVI